MTSYADVRDLIKDGMCVFLQAKTCGQRIIQFFTFGNVTHCGMAFWVTESTGKRRLMCTESTSGGVRAINLGAYANRRMIIVDLGVDWSTVSDSVAKSTGTVHYSLLDFITIGIRGILRRMRIEISVPNYIGEVCSEYLARLINESGTMTVDTMLSPNDLFESVKYRALNIIELEATKVKDEK